MRKLLLAAIIVILPSGVAEPESYATYSFATPIQWDGTSTSSGLTWIVIVMAPEDQGKAVIQAPGSQAVNNHSAIRLGSDSSQAGGFGTWNLPSNGYRESLPAEGILAFNRPEWKSLYIEGENLTIAMGGQGMVAPLSTGSAVETGFDNRNHPATATHLGYHRIGERTVGLATSRGGDESTAVALSGTFHVVEWHNATADCADSPCWPSSTSDQHSLSGQSATILRYTEVVASGVVDYQGTAWAVAAGGQEVSMHVIGQLRLPALRSESSCNTCLDPQGSTLVLRGESSLSAMRWHGSNGDRLTSSIASQSGQVRLDESVINPTLLGLVGASAAAAVAGVGLTIALVKLLLPLFSRVRRDSTLDNPRRRAVHDAVEGQPGMSFSGLVRLTGLAPGTVRHHLGVLQRQGFVKTASRGNTVRHFSAATDHRQFNSLAILQDDLSRTICLHVGSKPGVVQNQIVAAFSGVPRSTIQFKVRQLVKADILAAEKIGRQCIYAPGKHFPASAVAAIPNEAGLQAT